VYLLITMKLNDKKNDVYSSNDDDRISGLVDTVLLNLTECTVE